MQSFEGTFLNHAGEMWIFRGRTGQFTVDPKQIVWCFPRERSAPPQGWVLLRRVARYLADDLFSNADRTQAYELVARLASEFLHKTEQNSTHTHTSQRYA